jgi:DNA topoisomerase I
MTPPREKIAAETNISTATKRTKSPGTSLAAPSAPTPQLQRLVYVNDEIAGFTRHRRGQRFRYRDTRGHWLTDPSEIKRIDSLAIPPAYVDVWICPLANGHLQATGRDARGRKQYRYHATWRVQRDETKFERLEAFGVALPRIRARVARDLVPPKGKPPGRTVVLATLVRLLDTTFICVGNDEYARENGSFGLTTLRTPHAGVRGSTLKLDFRGKSGVRQSVTLDDPKVAAVVRQCQQLPGQELFQYVDEDGEAHTLDSADVNDYIAEISAQPGKAVAENGERFTAKDFRTWHGTVQALELTRLACSGAPLTTDLAPVVYSAKTVLAEVAKLLGNTPAVCRKSYIHPAVMALGSTLAKDEDNQSNLWRRIEGGLRARRLRATESRLLAFLKDHRRLLKAQARTLPAVRAPKARAIKADSTEPGPTKADSAKTPVRKAALK